MGERHPGSRPDLVRAESAVRVDDSTHLFCPGLRTHAARERGCLDCRYADAVWLADARKSRVYRQSVGFWAKRAVSGQYAAHVLDDDHAAPCAVCNLRLSTRTEG